MKTAPAKSAALPILIEIVCVCVCVCLCVCVYVCVCVWVQWRWMARCSKLGETVFTVTTNLNSCFFKTTENHWFKSKIKICNLIWMKI